MNLIKEENLLKQEQSRKCLICFKLHTSLNHTCKCEVSFRSLTRTMWIVYNMSHVRATSSQSAKRNNLPRQGCLEETTSVTE